MKKYCINHPLKEAMNTCHHCGNYYCDECLNEGHDYYYCNRAKCSEKYLEEILPEKVKCPECSKMIELDIKERAKWKFTCPVCGRFIDRKTYPDSNLEPIEYVFLAESLNLGDIGLLKSILNEADIDFFISGENFLNIDPLIQTAKLYVRKDRIEAAKEMLKDFELHIYGASAQTNREE